VSDAFASADRAQFSRSRARKVAQVSLSLREKGAHLSNQCDIWDEIAAKSVRMSAASATGAMAAIYEQSRKQLNDYVDSAPKHDGQVGAIFSISGQIAGVDIFASADTFAKASAKLIRSYAVDALESDTQSSGAGLGKDAVRAFLDEVGGANVTRFKAVGLGDDLRLSGLALAGAALEISGDIVHLVAFPAAAYEDRSDVRSQYTRMAPPRLRRTLF